MRYKNLRPVEVRMRYLSPPLGKMPFPRMLFNTFAGCTHAAMDDSPKGEMQDLLTNVRIDEGNYETTCEKETHLHR